MNHAVNEVGFFVILATLQFGNYIEAVPAILPPAIGTTVSSIPEHHLKQWEGRCNCAHDVNLYCDGGAKGYCHHCGMFCDKNLNGQFEDEAKCKEMCPARYDQLNPPTTTTHAPTEQSTVSPSSKEQSAQMSSEAIDKFYTGSESNISQSFLNNSSLASRSKQYQNWALQNWRWLLGGLFVLIGFVLIICLIKYHSQIHAIVCISKLPMPEQVTEDPTNKRAPLILIRNGQPPVPPVQQDASVPLTNGNHSLGPWHLRDTIHASCVSSGGDASIARSGQTLSTFV
ncbi:uncharacterized protein [Amphiura filiformis]|uniref:uncharacterized protein n=1 Tax=Amphiura filiformis TaxID=82378 RepID=UPI003B21D80B